MRGRSSCKLSNKSSMEAETPKLKEVSHFSGACIRRLVKQLSSSRPRETVMARDHSHFQDPNDGLTDSQEPSPPLPPSPPPPPPPHRPKKQVRRRLQTGRPYQEKLLNMAEARREIVTALKFHRAAMKRATEQHKQQNQLLHEPPPPPISQASTQSEDSHNELVVDSLKTPMAFPFSQFSYCSPCWICPQINPIPIYDTLNLPLPDQPLGLNLNFQAFPNIATSLVCNSSKTHLPQPPLTPSPSHSTSSQSSSESFSSPATASSHVVEAPSNPPGPTLHPAMGDEEMAEIRLISEKHDIEWNDEVNWMTSAWWSKFLTTVEVGAVENVEGDEVVDAPTPVWLRDGSGVDNHMEDHLQDACLLW